MDISTAVETVDSCDRTSAAGRVWIEGRLGNGRRKREASVKITNLDKGYGILNSDINSGFSYPKLC